MKTTHIANTAQSASGIYALSVLSKCITNPSNQSYVYTREPSDHSNLHQEPTLINSYVCKKTGLLSHCKCPDICIYITVCKIWQAINSTAWHIYSSAHWLATSAATMPHTKQA